MHYDQLIPTLTQLGLEEKQAKVYIAALEGAGTVAELATRAELKRPTVYLIVDELKAQGLLSEATQGSKTVYTAASPTVLRQLAEQRLKSVTELLPQLESLTATQAGRPNVRVLEGRSGLEQVYREMLEQREVRFWSDIGAVEELFPDVLERFHQAVKAGTLIASDIETDAPAGRKYARWVKKQRLANLEVRIARGQRLFGDSFTYGDVIVLTSLKAHNLYLVRIESPDLARSMRVLFDLAWQSAKRS